MRCADKPMSPLAVEQVSADRVQVEYFWPQEGPAMSELMERVYELAVDELIRKFTNS